MLTASEACIPSRIFVLYVNSIEACIQVKATKNQKEINVLNGELVSLSYHM